MDLSPTDTDLWHHRGYLPHYELGEQPVFVTFRLADSLPAEVVEKWKHELRDLARNDARVAFGKRVEDYLDAGHGSCVLGRPSAASTVENALKFFDGERYTLHAWVVMQNHVHTGLTPLRCNKLRDIVGSWKRYTATRINQRVGRSGRLWQRDYWDRWVRGEAHFKRGIWYIHNNPVRANLCAAPEDWRWSSARTRRSFAACKPPCW